MKLEPPLLPWTEPWSPLDGELQVGLAEELHREICNPEHILFGREVLAIGTRRGLDDFLFYLGPTPPSFALVHLTWSREKLRDFPYSEVFETAEDWIERGLKPSILDYEQSRKRRDGAA
jgi:hypothetical protein